MKDHDLKLVPPTLARQIEATQALGFSMGSEPQTGALLATLVAGKPGGRFLELGTGTGIGTAWMLAGMDPTATLDTVENDPTALRIARDGLGTDPRLRFHEEEGGAFLTRMKGGWFDLIFADTWPGKYTHLEEALAMLPVGGIYFIDDLLPQPNWAPDHAPKVPRLIAKLESRTDLRLTKLCWATGLIIAVKTSPLATNEH